MTKNIICLVRKIRLMFLLSPFLSRPLEVVTMAYSEYKVKIIIKNKSTGASRYSNSSEPHSGILV